MLIRAAILCIWYLLPIDSSADKFKWPVGTTREYIGTTLKIYRDVRHYPQMLLIRNISSEAILLQEESHDDEDIIPSHVIGRNNLAVLQLYQRPISLLCIEQFPQGERKVPCKVAVQAGLLPDNISVDEHIHWYGSFANTYKLSLSLAALGLYIVL